MTDGTEKPPAERSIALAPDVNLVVRPGKDGAEEHVAQVLCHAGNSQQEITKAVARARQVCQDRPELICAVEVIVDAEAAAQLQRAAARRAKRAAKAAAVAARRRGA